MVKSKNKNKLSYEQNECVQVLYMYIKIPDQYYYQY